MISRLTREQAAIIGAYTGYTAGPFGDVHGYAEKLFGYPLWTHQFADRAFAEKLRELAKPDFLALAFTEEGETP